MWIVLLLGHSRSQNRKPSRKLPIILGGRQVPGARHKMFRGCFRLGLHLPCQLNRLVELSFKTAKDHVISHAVHGVPELSSTPDWNVCYTRWTCVLRAFDMKELSKSGFNNLWAAVSMLVLGTVSVGLRLLIRLSTKLPYALSDALIIASLAMLAVYCAMMINC